jgi:hypothetical protein
MNVQAVVDRFEEDKAVILVGEEQEELVVDREKLPPGTREGDWLRAEIQDNVLLGAELDPGATQSAQARIADKLERLRRGEQLC